MQRDSAREDFIPDFGRDVATECGPQGFALGQPFDPAIHEAVMREGTDAYPVHTVCNVLQKGYMIHDRLLRPAMVSVACGSEVGN